jgi:hypothetical protein
MTFKRSFISDEKEKKDAERRSGLNRRWIKAPYEGVERRSGTDRRSDMYQELSSNTTVNQLDSIEKLVISTTLRLEALARLLVAKGILSPEELAEMLRTIQAEYQPHPLRED